MRAKIWMLVLPMAGQTTERARWIEDFGGDGLGVADTQNLAGDPYAALSLAGHTTSHIGLGTAVTNPITRHPAVTASAILTVQAESAGRAVLGIGRGDRHWRILDASLIAPNFKRICNRCRAICGARRSLLMAMRVGWSG